MQYELAIMDWEKGWVQQFHLGAARNNNTRLLRNLGRDIGVDSIGDYLQIEMMSRFFDRLDQEEKLAKTVIYNVNPTYNEAFVTMTGNFQDGTIRGKCNGSACGFDQDGDRSLGIVQYGNQSTLSHDYDKSLLEQNIQHLAHFAGGHVILYSA
jgi:glucuronate isomerase